MCHPSATFSCVLCQGLGWWALVAAASLSQRAATQSEQSSGGAAGLRTDGFYQWSVRDSDGRSRGGQEAAVRFTATPHDPNEGTLIWSKVRRPPCVSFYT